MSELVGCRISKDWRDCPRPVYCVDCEHGIVPCEADSREEDPRDAELARLRGQVAHITEECDHANGLLLAAQEENAALRAELDGLVTAASSVIAEFPANPLDHLAEGLVYLDESTMTAMRDLRNAIAAATATQTAQTGGEKGDA
jgi:hypothetical protein